MTPLTDDEELGRAISWHGDGLMSYLEYEEAKNKKLLEELPPYMRFEGTEGERLATVSKMCNEMIAELDGVEPLPKLKQEVMTKHLGAQRMEKTDFGLFSFTATLVLLAVTTVLTGSFLL